MGNHGMDNTMPDISVSFGNAISWPQIYISHNMISIDLQAEYFYRLQTKLKLLSLLFLSL